MTALAGYWRFDGRPDAPEQCGRMLKAQRIYGPQPAAIAGEGALSLGCRLFHRAAGGSRAAIAEGADGALLVADLRLDNRPELCAELGLSGRRAAELSDAALLLRAFERWGEGAVERIHGDFALAWWDPGHRRLTLARDCLGQKPLHYSRSNGFFAFASMAKGLHALEEVPVAPDLEAAAAFVALLPESGSETFFRGVEKVRAGHLVTVTPDGIRSERWWRPSVAVSRNRDHAEGLRHHFDRAVSDRLGDGAVASHLSAGLDSGSVTATAAGLLAASGRRLTAFTAVPRQGYDGPAHPATITDEGPIAAELAALYPNIDHVIVQSGGSPIADLDRNFFLYERPVLNLCNMVWAHRILDEARARSIEVLLTGQYGNMSISYGGLPLLNQLLARGRWLRLARETMALRRGGTSPGLIASQLLGPMLPKPLWTAINRSRGRGFALADYSAILPDAAERMQLLRRAAERGFDTSYRPWRDPVEERLSVLQRVDLGNYNKGTLAGWGIEQRDATADRRLIEFCLSVPLDRYLRSGVTRALARTAFADRLPPSVRDEQRRGHQGADWHEGLAEAQAQGALGAELRSIGGSLAASVIDIARMQGFEASLPVSDWHKPAVVWPYRLALLRGVSAGHFIRRAEGSNA
jgi:asparagine synthase (glutamine-hydrolysing)